MRRTLAILALLLAGGCRDTEQRGAMQKPVEKPTSSNMPESATSSGLPSAESKGTGTASSPATVDQANPQGAPSTTGGTASTPSPSDTPPSAPTTAGAGDTTGATTLPTYDYGQRDTMASDLAGRLQQVDAKIAQLEARTDAKAKRVAADLRNRREQLSRALDKVRDQTLSGWNDFQARVSTSFAQIERDVDDALR